MSASATVPEGYKQTEIGVIPEDWEIKKISTIASIRGRVGWKGYTKKDLVPFGAYAIGAKHIDSSNRLDLSDPTFLSQEKYHESPEIMVIINDILIVQRGTIGKVAIVNRTIGEATINPSMIIIRTRDASPRYLTYYLQSFPGQGQILLDTSSTGVPMITQKQIGDFSIPLPLNLEEQDVISDCIDDVQSNILSLEKLIGKKRDIKQGTMQELLSKSDSWQSKAIGEIASKKKWSMTGGPFGSNLQSRDHTDSGVRIIQLQNIGDGVFIDKHTTFTSESKADELLANNIFSGEIILSKMGDPVARGCLVPGINERFVMCSDGIRLLVNEEKFNTNFVLLMINHYNFRKSAENASTGSTRKRIGLTELRDLKIKCPEFSEQQKIASIIVNMDAEITALEQRLEKTKAIKQGMMQQLLTGRIRLVDPGTPVEASA
jgi:type I restriction enzyme, S subunit